MNKFSAIVVVLIIALAATTACSNKKDNAAIQGDRMPVRTINDMKMDMLPDSGNHIADPDGFLLPKTKERNNKRIHKLQTAAGVNMAYAVAGRIDKEDVRDFALELGNKFGKQGSNQHKNIIVVIAVEQKKWYMAIGSGLKKEFPDTICEQINHRSIANNVSRGNPDKAVNDIMDAVYERIKPKSTETDF